MPLRFFLFGLRLPLLTLENEGCGENRHGQSHDPNQHAGIAGGGGIAAAGLNGHIAHSGIVMAIQGNEGENGAVDALGLHIMELNDYICEAVRKRDLSYFSFFLHHFEKRLNGVIYRFLARNGYDRYDPARFLDCKLEILQMLLFCLPRFDPAQETEFLKYAKHYIQDGLLFCRMMGEAGSFASLAEYRRVRQIGAIYNGSGKSRAEVVSEFAAQSGYKDGSVSADELLTIAQRNRSIVSLYRTEQDEDGEWGELRFDFENGTAEIVNLADWDTVKSNIFAKTAIQFVQRLPEARLLKSVVVPFWKGRA